MKVIIHKTEKGNVAVTVPTGEVPIEQVLVKDCPEGAIIIDDSELPTEYFDAWELVDGSVVVNESKKQAIIAEQESLLSAKESALNKLSGLGLTDAEIKALIGNNL